jgi:exodeoxyribonuclease VII large subunit
VPDTTELRASLDGLSRRLGNLLGGRVATARARFESLAARRVLRQPEVLLESRAQSLDLLADRLGRAAAGRLARASARLEGLGQTLGALDPQRVLGRGYAIVLRENDGQVVQCPQDLPPGAVAVARLAAGRLRLISDGEL